MRKNLFNSIVCSIFVIIAIAFLCMAYLTVLPKNVFLLNVLGASNENSALFFSTLSIAFSFIFLVVANKPALNRPLTKITYATTLSLLFIALTLNALGNTSVAATFPALGAALLAMLRAAAVIVLPPRGDHRGVRDALVSLALAVLTAGAWVFLDPTTAPIAATTSLVLSWPSLVDGINAFADKVFHRAALAAGVREMSPDTFAQLAAARNIVIDKAAVMSGPDLLVTNVMAFDNEPRTLLAVAASAEAQSDHPVARALRKLADDWNVDLKTPDRFEATPGKGVVSLLGGQTVVIGTTALLTQLKIDSFTADAIARSLEAVGKTVLRVAVGGKVVGVLGLEGTLRQDAGVAGNALRKEGLVPWLHSGDNTRTRVSLADFLGLEYTDEPVPGESAFQHAARRFPDRSALVLTLSADRTTLELFACGAESGPAACAIPTPIAVSDTDDIGAIPALKALAMCRARQSIQARRLVGCLLLAAGLLGAVGVLPLLFAPLLFAVNLAILRVFAGISATDTLYKPSQAG